MMNIKKATEGMLAATALMVTFGVAAHAASPDTIANVHSATTLNNTTFTSSAGGDSLLVTYGDGVFNTKAGAQYTGVAVTFNATGGSTTDLGGGDFKETFTGGTFSAFSGTTDLLSGSFTSGKINGSAGDGTGAFGASNVTYDAASTAVPATDTLVNGLLTVTFNPINGGYVLSGGQLQSFTATDSAVYSAVPAAVPEATGLVPFALGGLCLLGLIVRGRKTRQTSEMAS